MRDPMNADVRWMEEALLQATAAGQMGEVPIGAVLVKDGAVLARGHNLVVTRHDPTAHAELLALQDASLTLQNERLMGTVMYTTLEPCPMCVGALMLARVDRVVFGAPDPKAGALGSVVDLMAPPAGNHRFAVTGGVLETAAQSLLQKFFQARRTKPASGRHLRVLG